MKNIIIKEITDLKEAEEAWKKLSPNETIFDDWDFRIIYYNFFNYPIHFYAGFDGDELVGLLGLQYTEHKKCLEFFGGGYFDDNKLLVKPGYEETAPIFFSQIKMSASLQFMKQNYEGVDGITLQDQRYFLPIEGFSSSSEYIEKMWSGKSKQNFKAQIRKLEANDIKIVEDDFSNYEKMVELNINRFGEDSSFKIPYRTEFFKKAMEKFQFHTIGIFVNGKLESVGLSAVYNGIYNGLNSGTNPEINGLGKYLVLKKIDQAIKTGSKIYDANVGDLGWKESFKFEKRPQYKFEFKT